MRGLIVQDDRIQDALRRFDKMGLQGRDNPLPKYTLPQLSQEKAIQKYSDMTSLYFLSP